MSQWLFLQNEQQLKELNEQSYNGKGVGIFKHSSRCLISAMARRKMEKGLANLPEDLSVYYLDIIQLRKLSQKVAEYYDIQHESPQLLLIKEGQCIYHTSHQGVSPRVLLEHSL